VFICVEIMPNRRRSFSAITHKNSSDVNMHKVMKIVYKCFTIAKYPSIQCPKFYMWGKLGGSRGIWPGGGRWKGLAREGISQGVGGIVGFGQRWGLAQL